MNLIGGSIGKNVKETVTDIPFVAEKDKKAVRNKQGDPILDPKDERITKKELKSIFGAMDREGFDGILDDYMKEISNPDNVKEQNQYLSQMKDTKDLPPNVNIVQPKAGFCIKTEKFQLKRPSVRQKIFINICCYDRIGIPAQDPNHPGMWSLPYLVNKARNDQDSKKRFCLTYDVVFHPVAIDHAKASLAFKKFVCDSAINGLNANILKVNQESASSDYSFVKKFEYKGAEISFMNIHGMTKGEFDDKKLPTDQYKTKQELEIEESKKKKDKEENKDNAEEERELDKLDVDEKDSGISKVVESSVEVHDIKPKYKIKYSNVIELTNYFYNPSGTDFDSGKNRKLIVEISVPKLENLSMAKLNIDNKKILFKYKDTYELDIDLPDEINKDNSVAKFDRGTKVLSLTCEIIQKEVPKVESKLEVKEDDIEIIKEENGRLVNEDITNENNENKENVNTENKENNNKENLNKENHNKENLNNQNQTTENKPDNKETKPNTDSNNESHPTTNNTQTEETKKNEMLELQTNESQIDTKTNNTIKYKTELEKSILKPPKIEEIINDEDDKENESEIKNENSKSEYNFSFPDQKDSNKINYLIFNCPWIGEIV